MSAEYDEKTLAFDAELWPESDGLVEKADEWWLGLIAIRKSDRPAVKKERPTYRRGWTYTLEAGHRFVEIPFSKPNGDRAIAIVLRGGNEDIFGGWFRASRASEAKEIVARLNSELDQERRRYPEVAEPTITLEMGSEQAPDAPFGRELLAMSSDGSVSYERHDGGQVTTHHGLVDRARWSVLRAALGSTTFPQPPQESFEPGASVMRLTVSGPGGGQVLLDYFDSLEMPGYKGVTGPLAELIAALRTGDAGQLSAWGFRPAAPVPGS